MLNRRRFLENCGLLAAASYYPAVLQASESGAVRNPRARELKADVVIIGGGLGGCAAAKAACRAGATVILTEPTDWIGGQLSQQAVPPDEHGWIESFGAPASYRDFRNKVRQYYRDHYPLTEAARQRKNLNPGNGSVSRLCHEPRTALAVLDALLAPEISRGKLTLLLNTSPVSADGVDDRVRTITCRNQAGQPWVLHADYFVDASEEGDVLPLTKTEYVVGAESQSETGEPHAAENADPNNVQSFTWCFLIDHLVGEDHTIERPEQYEFWKEHVPNLTPPWSGRLLDLSYSSPKTLEPRALQFVPCGRDTEAPKTKTLNLWLYRRLIHRSNFVAGSYASDITCVNWPQNDYMLGSIIDVPAAERAKHLRQSQQLSLSLLYWLQTEAPRPDGGQGWKGLRLRHDAVGTSHGLAKYPYIRESRRIKAAFTVKEEHVSAAERRKVLGETTKPLLGKPFFDSVGIGSYHLDLHPSSGGDNYIDFASVPFQIPLGALLPQRVQNLMPACKNIGTTHISNGCYRLHPVEWSIGEAVGLLCGYAMNKRVAPHEIRNKRALLGDFQSFLTRQGVGLSWENR